MIMHRKGMVLVLIISVIASIILGYSIGHKDMPFLNSKIVGLEKKLSNKQKEATKKETELNKKLEEAIYELEKKKEDIKNKEKLIEGANSSDSEYVLAFKKKQELETSLKKMADLAKKQSATSYKFGYNRGYSTGYNSGYNRGHEKGKRDLDKLQEGERLLAEQDGERERAFQAQESERQRLFEAQEREKQRFFQSPEAAIKAKMFREMLKKRQK